MINAYKQICGILVFTLTILEGIQSFHITECNSNKISVKKFNRTTKKAVISYDEREKIELDKPGASVKIWCESDTPFKKCVLKQGNQEKCEYAYPPCKTSNCSNNQRISYAKGLIPLTFSENQCDFPLTNICELNARSMINLSLLVS